MKNFLRFLSILIHFLLRVVTRSHGCEKDNNANSDLENDARFQEEIKETKERRD